MSHAEALEPIAVKSYRYLRLSIVVVVASLLASVVIERLHVDCWQESISAYFYTPVRSMFVGALIVIGVSLIAIMGGKREDVLLNLAGVLAPIVAFVPTSPPARQCSSVEVVATDAEPFIDNNVLAFAVGGVAALLIAFAVAMWLHRPAVVVEIKRTLRGMDAETRAGLGAGVVLLVAGLVWYFGFRENFLERAHGGAAVAMFALVGVVMVLNARDRDTPPEYRRLYWLTAGAMVLSAVAVLIGTRIDDDWRHAILWLEILELTAFLFYWVFQTFQHWNGGVPDKALEAGG